MSRISFSLINCDREFSRRRSHFCLINPCKQKDKLYFLHKRCLLALHHLSVRESHRILSLDDTLFFSSSFIEKKTSRDVGKICLDVLSKPSSSLFSLDIPYSRGASEVRSLECSGKRTSGFRRKKEKKDSLPTGEISTPFSI